MLIENVEALKSWLAKLLEPICDADPSALANYVVALVKKDKSEKELKAFCADQLDVFLQKETTGFVDKLFESLFTKNYLPVPETIKQETKPTVQVKEEIKDVGPEKQHLCPPAAGLEPVEEQRDGKKRKFPSPQSNSSDLNERRTRDRKRDDGKWREYDRYHDRNDVYREKYDWRRGKSKSPVKSKPLSRSRSRSRGRSRDQDPNRNRDHRERSKFECERSEVEVSYMPVSMPPSNSVEQYSSGGQAIPSTVTVIAPAHEPENTTESWSNYYNNHGATNSFVRKPPPKRRCRDYDERGYCVLGDLCQFDHGNDPLVVDEVSLPSIIPFPPPPGLPPPSILMPPLPGPAHNMRMPVPRPHGQTQPPGVLPLPRLPLTQPSLLNNREQPGTSTVPSLAPVAARLPPPLPQNMLYTVSEHTYEPDGYNPEAPSITNAGRTQYRQFFSRTLTQRPNLIGLTSGDMDTNPRAANIVIQTEPSAPVTTNSNTSRVVVEPDRKRPLCSMEGPAAKKPWVEKPGNNHQNKPGFVKKSQYTNTKLEVRKIPQELNNITKLNEHFSKFGTIVNIQVAFKGDPEGALIQYLTNDEARRAISSTEAVLNNRFIRVLWHRENNEQSPLQQQPILSSPQQLQHYQQQHHLHQTQTVQPPSTTAVQGNVQKVIHKPAASYMLNKVSVKHRLGVTSGIQTDTAHSVLNQPVTAVDDSQMFPSSAAHTKMVYTSTSLKTAVKPAAVSKSLDIQDALKKKQEALKLQQDMRKKKQEMLEKQIECQKMLISKLEKNKTMKAEERAEIMKTLKDLGEKISQLKDELKTFSTSSKVKSKTEAQKELLDAELDLHKRLTSGEDTTDLRKKLSQLQVEAARLGILPTSRGKASSVQSRGRGRGRGARGRGTLNHMVVDHRPKALAVCGFVEEEKEDLLQHFSKFGDLEDLKEDDAPSSVVLTFKTRSEAENAANHGSRFRGRRLQISWHKPKTPSVSTDIEEEESKDEEVETSDLFLHEDDDEDEDEDESRSWRR
ncbi:RNA-binding protein 27 isoform X2 [Microcaecilia unicolor]|uniref:RNA-binding protein 27 isoform X2 n=1 Tax=Microcaecilia unicolor TaxID=1415580 RepID=A0A6P7YRS6_9AMPH|nr:RNA-binding protein 27 isoform X2 [Microcaecilia unicolor]